MPIDDGQIWGGVRDNFRRNRGTERRATKRQTLLEKGTGQFKPRGSYGSDPRGKHAEGPAPRPDPDGDTGADADPQEERGVRALCLPLNKGMEKDPEDVGTELAPSPSPPNHTPQAPGPDNLPRDNALQCVSLPCPTAGKPAQALLWQIFPTAFHIGVTWRMSIGKQPLPKLGAS